MSCLCLGAQSAGKSLLLKYLQNHPVNNVTPIETVGTNILTIPNTPSNPANTKPQKRDKDGEIEVREVGGSMAALWPSYYGPKINTVVYVIDSSNLFQVSISTVMLMEILSHEKLRETKILVVLSKKDLTTRKRLNYLKFMMRLENILQESEKRLTVEEVSALTGEGMEKVRSWIFNNRPPKGKTMSNRRP